MLRPHRRSLAIVALLAGAAALPAQAPPVSAPPARDRAIAALDSVARLPVERGEVAGLAVVVLRGRDTLLARAHGRADVARGVPLDVRDVFPIASLTKQLAATAVLRLVEQGRVGLDDDVARHLPDDAAAAVARELLGGRRVTIRQLLTHTAGLPDFAGRPDRDSGRAGDGRGGAPTPGPLTALRRVQGVAFDFAPGSALRYSNTGYVLLGLVIERYAGRPFAEEITRTLFADAGMGTAGGCAVPGVVPGAAVDRGPSRRVAFVPGHRRTGDGVVPVAPLHPGLAHAAGGTHVCASALDLAAWNSALHGGRLLRPASYAAMTTGAHVHDAGDTVRTHYGFGVALTPLAGRRAVHHGGDVDGYATYLAYLPDDSLSVVVLLNTDGSTDQRALTERLVRAASGAAPAERAMAGGPSPAELAGLVGRYGDGPAAFAMAGDRLAFVWGDGPPEPLRWVGGRSFTNGASRFTFVTRPGVAPAVWADLTYVVARWERGAAAPPPRATGR